MLRLLVNQGVAGESGSVCGSEGAGDARAQVAYANHGEEGLVLLGVELGFHSRDISALNRR